jgi:hypothetical protein
MDSEIELGLVATENAQVTSSSASVESVDGDASKLLLLLNFEESRFLNEFIVL